MRREDAGVKLTAQQIAQYAINAGFSGPDLTVAVAVAFGESRGDPDAYNHEINAGAPDGQGSVGLFQIYTKDWPHLAKWNLRDPQVNACAANVVWIRQGWNAWSSYKLKTPGYRNGLVLAQTQL